jgi:demethylmenaquinone methyltransferase/2-methoxy-6-polyprenyl-1,4-benzoquinol methylase
VYDADGRVAGLSGREPLAAAFVSAAAKRRYNRRLFGLIADRYDLVTRVLSFGQDQRWKRRLVAMAAVRPGERAYDLACGTGDLARLAAGAGAAVIGLDLAPRMLQHAARNGTPRVVAGDMTDLPLASASASLVTVGYGLRNVPALGRALEEIHRVLAPGGRLLVLEFTRPEPRLLRAAYLGYLTAVGSVLGLALHGDADTYRYIAASLRRYPGAAEVCRALRAAGFASARWVPLLGGLMGIHEAQKGG